MTRVILYGMCVLKVLEARGVEKETDHDKGTHRGDGFYNTQENPDK